MSGRGLALTGERLEILTEEGDRVCGRLGQRRPAPSVPHASELLLMPYSLDPNDILIFTYSDKDGPQLLQMVKAFDTLYREGAEHGRVMDLALHPYIIGQPQRDRYFDVALAAVERCTGARRAQGASVIAFAGIPLSTAQGLGYVELEQRIRGRRHHTCR